MQIENGLAEWIRLSLTPGIGGESVRKLLRIFGLPQQIFLASHSALAQVVSKSAAQALLDEGNQEKVEQILTWAAQQENYILTLADTDYPKQLFEIPDPPVLLYIKGRRELLNFPSLAIVGSRNPTPQGLLNAEKFAENLSQAGLTIVSGLASGIDTAAHQGGLKGTASTIAVIGTGLDIVYPARNRDLAHQIADKGALLSEFPLGAPALAHHFPRRNRIISGLTKGCLVVEAAQASGSLITARLAAEQGREVFAIPGSIHSPVSKGCHKLIKEGAKLVESAQDILEELGEWSSVLSNFSDSGSEKEPDPTSNQAELLQHMGYDTLDIDSLCERSGLASEVVSTLLLKLELEGQVGRMPGGLYQRLA